MKWGVLFTVVTLMLGTGCTRKPFQPNPPKFQEWAKEGVSITGVKDALIDCGYDNPYNGFDVQKKVSFNELVRADRCMEKKGFKYLSSDRQSVCQSKAASAAPACVQEIIPKNGVATPDTNR